MPPSELPPELLGWLADRAQQAEVEEDGARLVGRFRRHWAPGFVPANEIEALMGRPVDPMEEFAIRREISAMLRRHMAYHGKPWTGGTELG